MSVFPVMVRKIGIFRVGYFSIICEVIYINIEKKVQKKENALALRFPADDYSLGSSYVPLSTFNCTKETHDCQFAEQKELELKFSPKRKDAELLAESYKRLGYLRKYDRVLSCGTILEFAHSIDMNGVVSDKGKLHNANFCRDRLCPMCSWRRSYKIFAQVSTLMRHCGDKYNYLFLTLTAPNCHPEDLNQTLDKFFNAWSKLVRRSRFKKAVKGFFRAFEVTYNHDIKSLSFGTYHPHFHCVLVVSKSYFNSRSSDYITQSEWLELWRDCMNDESISQVDIRRAKGKNGSFEVSALSSAIAEIAKYAVKSSDYLFDDLKMTDEVVRTLSNVLEDRRLITFDRAGVFGSIRIQLSLGDPEEGDLIHLDNEVLEPAIAYQIVRYGWSVGVGYTLSTSYIKQLESEVSDVG